MQPSGIRARLPLAMLIGAVGLAACGSRPEQMQWARAALERNPALEVVAADEREGVFTLRMRDSGELRTVRADELVASPEGATAAAASEHAMPAQPPQGIALPLEPAAPAAQPDAATDAAGPAGVAAASSASGPAEPPAPTQADAPDAPAPPSAAGRVIASGPGYSISTSGDAAAAAQRPAAARPVVSPSAPLERRPDPIVCQGERFLRLDNRNIEFDGDALRAEAGCELYVTNSRIVARGIGVAASAANVHIRNSYVEGAGGAIEASDGAQVYIHGSAFRGMTRRLDSAVLHDQGSNRWQ